MTLPNGPFAAMSLAAITYLSESDPSQQKSQMSAALLALPTAAGGPWTLEWGPSNNAGNLVFVALNSSKNVYAVAVRGTVEDDVTGFFTNILEDLDSLSLVPWLYPQSVTGAQIASGTNIALAQVIAMTDPVTDLGLLDYLRSVISGSNAQVIVTGHSLGGTLSSVVAPWIADQLPKAGNTGTVAVTPYTFAAPSAGNQAFVDYYTKLFPNSYRSVNTFDLAPMAWTELASIQTMYPTPGQLLWDYSKLLYGLVESAKLSVGQLYAQTNQQAGTDSFQGPAISQLSFAAEAMTQHDHNVYLQHVTPAS
ncbi:MAG TPA: lipase family protein [Pyrinomonadaceae bacterium]|nr:lipase family protein [Pyrinomonadaceae bacterium]